MSAIKLNELAELCLKHRMPAVAAADSINMFAALDFSQAMAAKGIRSIIGECVLLERHAALFFFFFFFQSEQTEWRTSIT